MTFLLSFLPLFVFYSSSLQFSLVVLFSWVYYLMSSFNFSNQFTCLNMFVFDEVCLFIFFMTFFVMFISYVYSLVFKSYSHIGLVLLFMLVFCLGVFSTSNLFLLYFFYEASLIPILYIIIKWGSYPERSVSAVMLLAYTAVFTIPFTLVLFYVFSNSYTLSYLAISLSSSVFSYSFPLTLIVFATFAVKLPIYGLHFWLPIAHVEAPTFGSMILAGVLLKLGGVGLIRSIPLMNLSYLSDRLITYLIIFLCFSTLICCFQSDFNRLIAYSSVSHMMAIPLLILSSNIMSLNACIMLMLFHGLSSPVLFMLVGVVYSSFSTRQLVLIRGVYLISPLLSFVIILAFFFTLSAPPFPSFISEVFFLVSSFFLSPYLFYSFVLFTFLSLVYNLNWLSSIVFSNYSTSNYVNFLAYSSFMPIMVSFFLCPLFLVLLSFI